MKICYVGSGASPIVRRWATFFAAKGHEVHLITEEDAAVDKVTVHKIGGASEGRGFALKTTQKVLEVRHLLNTIKPDIVHAHYVSGYGTLAAIANHHPLIISAMGSDIGSNAHTSKILNAVVRLTLRRSDMLVVHDAAAAKRARQLGCPSNKTVILPSCCDTHFFVPWKKDQTLMDTLGITGHPTVLYTRSFKDSYRYMVFTNAVPRVLREMPDVRFIVVARGPDLPAWKEFVETQPWGKKVLFVPPIPHEMMPEMLSSVSVYVDTFYPVEDVGGHAHGTGTIEAMSCGCPQILPDRDEYKEPWCPALLYRRGESSDLARTIVQLLGDHDEWVRRSHKSRLMASSFDEEIVFGTMLEIYERMARGERLG